MKILVLTSAYRDPYYGKMDLSTNVVNSFVYEWKRNGNDVLVIHNSHQYPKVIHKLPLFIRKKLASFLSFQIPNYETIREKVYCDNGVMVYRFPIKKLVPHHSPSDKVLLKQLQKIEKALSSQKFVPDVMVGHWVSPQLELLSKLKPLYNCRTAIIMHGLGYIKNKHFKIEKYLKSIDKIGCRSISQAIDIKNELQLTKLPFVCYSGVPDDYLQKFKVNLHKFEKIKTWKIAFVGRLISYKNVDVIIRALSLIDNVNWELNIVGDGSEKNNLIKLANKLDCSSRVKFLGKVSRDDVMNILNNINMFIMVSNNEVFGLSYLEAMASSCITIASKNGGIDGIIVDSKNGFLCNQGDVNDLYKKLLEIFSMGEENIKELVKNSYNSVKEYSDSKVAELYLNNVIND